MINNIVLSNNGEIELKISLENETIWLTQKQISILFEKDVRTVNEHIKSIYKDEELLENTTIRKFRIVQKEGKREVTREVNHYNLDMILSIGYRVNSKKATKFRQWATKVLKEYIFNGYTINQEKITQLRLSQLEQDVELIKSHIKSDRLEYKHGIFFNGEIFDAYEFVSNLIRRAKKDIVLIDNYIDETVLTLFSKNQNIQISIYTQTISKQLKLDLDRYNAQYKPITIKKFNLSHDRFLIIDKEEVYHIGASLKDLGKKWFAFNQMDKESIAILEKLK
jgi:hypothetical protein